MGSLWQLLRAPIPVIAGVEALPEKEAVSSPIAPVRGPWYLPRGKVGRCAGQRDDSVRVRFGEKTQAASIIRRLGKIVDPLRVDLDAGFLRVLKVEGNG